MPNWIGDLVMATPFIEGLREKYPDAFITCLCSEGLKSLLENNPFIDEVMGFSRKKRFFPKDNQGSSLIAFLRKRQFDEGYLLTNSFSSAWIFWAGKVKKIVGFKTSFRSIFLTKGYLMPKNKAKIHLVEIYKKLIDCTKNYPLFLPPTSKVRQPGKIYIGINPGAAYGSAKCYLPERFREVCLRLVEEIPNVEVLLFGDKNTKSLVNDICKGLPSKVKNLAGKTSLGGLIEEIGSLDAFLTNDSGPMHMAAALKTPLVALFGSTNDIATGPYQWGKVINKRVSCAPCYKRVCPIDFKCMKQIEVTEIVQALKFALLEKIKIAKGLKGDLIEPVFFNTLPVEKINKTVGTIILAGGRGSRLGFSKPKGCLEIGGKSLYETLLLKAKGRAAVMTSTATHRETLRHLKEKGLTDVDVFQTNCFPRLTKDYEETPEGNGALFSAFYHSDLKEKWKDVDLFSVIPIDNPLADPFDPEMICHCDQLIVKAVKRQEKMGALVEIQGKLHVLEYSEMSEKNSWKLGYTGMFVCSKDFFVKASQLEMPWHIVEKQGIKHYEKFIFDAFFLANRYKILEKPIQSCFSPIKTKADLVAIEKKLYNFR